MVPRFPVCASPPGADNHSPVWLIGGPEELSSYPARSLPRGRQTCAYGGVPITADPFFQGHMRHDGHHWGVLLIPSVMRLVRIVWRWKPLPAACTSTAAVTARRPKMRTDATGGHGRIMVVLARNALTLLGQGPSVKPGWGSAGHRSGRAVRPFEHADPIGPVTE